MTGDAGMGDAGTGDAGTGDARTGDACVLVVEDEFLIAELLELVLSDMGLTVCASAATAAEAIALAERHAPRLVLMDVRLKGPGDGVDAAIAIHRSLGAKVIFITGSREPETVARIAQGHPTAVLFKPIRLTELKQAVRAAMA